MKFLFTLTLFISLCTSTNFLGQKIDAKTGFWSLRYYQEEEKISKEKFLQLLKTDSKAYSFWEKGKTYETISYPTAVLALGFTAWNISNISNDEFDAVPAIGGIITGIAGLIFLNKIAKNRKMAIQSYNDKISNKTTFRIEPSPRGLGILIVLN